MLEAKARGGKLYAMGTIDGQRVRKTMGLEAGSSRAVVRRKLEDIELEVKKQLSTGGKKKTTVEQVCRAYLSRPDGAGPTTKLYVENFMERYAPMEVEAIRPFDVYVWVRDRGNKPGSIRRELAAIETAMKWGEEAGMYALAAPFEFKKKPSPGDHRTRYFTPQEMAKMVRAADDWFRPLLVFLFYTGARLGEALATTWDDVSGRRVKLVSKKGRSKKTKIRWIDLHDEVRLELDGLPWKDGKLFRPASGDESAWRRWVYDAWNATASRAGIEDVNPHDARRTFASNLLNGGVDIRTVADLIGDSTLNMLMIYAQAWGIRKTKAVVTLPSLADAASHVLTH